MSLPCHIRTPEVTWHHFWSHDSSSCKLQPCLKVKCTVYGSFWPSTAPSRWLPFKWRLFRVTSGHLRSRDIISCHVTAACELQRCRKWNVQYTGVFGLLQPLPGDFPSNDVTCGHLRSRDISCHVTAFSCELLICIKCNVQYTKVSGLLQPVPGYFWWNDVTSGSLPVTWGLVMSFSVTWLPSPAS